MLHVLYGMRLAFLLHRMPRICSLSWLWRPVVARQGAFSTLCSIFSQWYHLLFILSAFQSASSVCRMTCCLGKYACARAFESSINVCTEGGVGVFWAFEHVFFLTDRNSHFSQSSCRDMNCIFSSGVFFFFPFRIRIVFPVKKSVLLLFLYYFLRIEFVMVFSQ